jgi:uncharacterized CHY-type Zn-finger protein
MGRRLLAVICLLLVGSLFPLSLSSRERQTYPVKYPPLTAGIFPCMNCHDDMERNKKRRPLKEMHAEIMLKHGQRWCYDCHSEKNMDRLRLAGGEEIKFEESHMVCGQCHGNVYNDWKKGIHGKRTGSWNGKKEYFLCVHCHDPHSPPFRALKPEPPPVPPEKTLFRRAK